MCTSTRRILIEPVDEVRRHPAAEVGAAHDETHGAAVRGEVQRGLTGGVRAADDDDGRVHHLPQLELRRGVVDAGALEVRPAIEVEPAVRGARRDDRGAGPDDAAVGEGDIQQVVRGLELHGLARRVDPHAELERLQRRLPDEVATAHAEGESEEVLDARRRRRLPARRDGIQQHGAQALGRAVDRGGEPGRPAADDDEVDDLVGVGLIAQPRAARRRCPVSRAGSARPG